MIISFMFVMMSIFLASVIVISVSVDAQIIKPNKNQYYTGDSVYVISTVSSQDNLCRTVTSENVKLFIVEHAETWNGGESLDDVRGDSSEVPNKKFSSKKVWEDIIVGLYDLVVDCNDNGNYDAGEPLYKEGFSVIAKQGSGTVILENPQAISWQYDSEALQSSVVMASLKISAVNENIALKNLTLRLSNSVPLALDAIEIYVDGNNNGKLESDDSVIGTFAVSELLATNTLAVIPLEHTLNIETAGQLLVVYKMKEESAEGAYSVEVLSLVGDGVLSGKTIVFSGTPLQSNKLIVMPKKTCLGEMTLVVEPASIYKNEKAVLKISNVNECDNKKVIVKSSFCYLAGDIGSCVLKDGSCSFEITASNNMSYYACLDKNNDEDYTDFGESISAELVVVSNTPAVKEETTEAPITGNVVETESETTPTTSESGITGQSIKNYFQETSPFLLVLEATLLLILLVLIMIMFRLGGSASGTVEPTNEGASELVEDEHKEPTKKKKVKEE